ncbi:MAG: hypothetical protein WCQ95_00885 [Bacteroidota bacterium]
MDIPKFVSSLTENELKQLRKYLKNENIVSHIDEHEQYRLDCEAKKEKETQEAWEAMKSRTTGVIPVIDFFDNLELPSRIRYIVKGLWDDRVAYYMDDITKKKFFTRRNAGKLSWVKMIDFIKSSLKGTIYEAHQEALLKHFEDQ